MTNDDHVERATIFNAEEASANNKHKYRRLSKLDNPHWDGGFRDEQQRTLENGLAIVDAVASTLELVPRQKEEAREVFEELPENYNQAYSTELLAITICGIVGYKDGRPYHPNAIHPSTNSGLEYAVLADEANIRYEQLFSCWRRIQGELE